MPNNKSLLTLDSDCHNILNQCDNKSEYVRKAIKFYDQNKNKDSEKATESQKPIVREVN